jgi:hypothetical protein
MAAWIIATRALIERWARVGRKRKEIDEAKRREALEEIPMALAVAPCQLREVRGQ